MSRGNFTDGLALELEMVNACHYILPLRLQRNGTRNPPTKLLSAHHGDPSARNGQFRLGRLLRRPIQVLRKESQRPLPGQLMRLPVVTVARVSGCAHSFPGGCPKPFNKMGIRHPKTALDDPCLSHADLDVGLVEKS